MAIWWVADCVWDDNYLESWNLILLRETEEARIERGFSSATNVAGNKRASGEEPSPTMAPNPFEPTAMEAKKEEVGGMTKFQQLKAMIKVPLPEISPLWPSFYSDQEWPHSLQPFQISYLFEVVNVGSQNRHQRAPFKREGE